MVSFLIGYRQCPKAAANKRVSGLLHGAFSVQSCHVFDREALQQLFLFSHEQSVGQARQNVHDSFLGANSIFEL
jgi:hypothetical protein